MNCSVRFPKMDLILHSTNPSIWRVLKHWLFPKKNQLEIANSQNEIRFHALSFVRDDTPLLLPSFSQFTSHQITSHSHQPTHDSINIVHSTKSLVSVKIQQSIHYTHDVSKQLNPSFCSKAHLAKRCILRHLNFEKLLAIFISVPNFPLLTSATAYYSIK